MAEEFGKGQPLENDPTFDINLHYQHAFDKLNKLLNSTSKQYQSNNNSNALKGNTKSNKLPTTLNYNYIDKEQRETYQWVNTHFAALFTPSPTRPTNQPSSPLTEFK